MQKQIKNFEKLSYVMMTPENFSPEKKYPVLFFLHGAGSRGTEIEKLVTNPFFTETEKYAYPMVTFAPQCYANSWFDIFEQLGRFILEMRKLPFADTERCYLMGASMGGYAAWQMAMTHPTLFAALVPICGGGMYWNAGRLAEMEIWAFHGSEDKTVHPEESQKMVEAVNARGGNAKLTVCEGVGHNVWMDAYNSVPLFEWLLAQKQKTPSQAADAYSDVKRFG